MDSTLVYPLPVDVEETDRQSLWTLLLLEIYGTPILSYELARKPPRRILEVGCDTGFWSIMCHKHFQSKGIKVSFVGIDIKPPSPPDASYAELDMDWQYIQQDMREAPWLLESGSFDLIMAKDMALVFTDIQYGVVMGEYLRLLRPGGTLEVWERDLSVRALKPQASGTTTSTNDMTSLGVYPVDVSTRLGPAMNPYLVEYNVWLTKALAKFGLTPVPCAVIGPALGGFLTPEAEALEGMISKRLAIPLSEIKWECQKGELRVLSPHQMAVRDTALECLVGLIDAFEPLLKPASNKNQDDWDQWFSKARTNLVRDRGANGGECLEIGIWSAQKKAC
ncbi:S-adenosyl-L-methionine-dependent methyltransferase [Pseudomassariella vexata]|uniref:S-adenosyl-L-methionine-dependent methyltransferase n=1 Tax=Pseudomassariella vexata TaxID=1141098 RepID=A0A1Y2DBJ4_9PEZI|nr:S-adenosyl-L-methionine-dependent methyltransferase [Pseudomassariella vexata]ORY56567.1 S-adenosyl-L-methionine-dependent methyltransferase [Pseudomassariella vexata]